MTLSPGVAPLCFASLFSFVFTNKHFPATILAEEGGAARLGASLLYVQCLDLYPLNLRRPTPAQIITTIINYNNSSARSQISKYFIVFMNAFMLYKWQTFDIEKKSPMVLTLPGLAFPSDILLKNIH